MKQYYNMKVIEMYVAYNSKSEAKKCGCRWDDNMKCWYVSLEKYNNDKNLYNPFRRLALADTNDVTNDTLKDLGCTWLSDYKKWGVDKTTYEKNKLQFDLCHVKVLTEITRVYNYVLPPVKSEEDQLAELMALMAYDGDSDEI